MTFVVEDALGEAYALRDTRVEAVEAKVQAELYLEEAAVCGHQSAPGWVSKRLPFNVREVGELERKSILEDATPVLDREP